MTSTAAMRQLASRWLGAALCLFVLIEVNLPHLQPQTQLAVYAGLGILLALLERPLGRRREPLAPGAPPPRRLPVWTRAVDGLLLAATVVVFGYVALASEPATAHLFGDGRSLGERAGIESPLDVALGALGLLLVLEAARRTVGWSLPILSIVFLAYAHFGPSLPDWLFPHRGYGWERIVTQTFLQVQGVFGVALKVMFTYVFLFVVFGAFLERTGATAFVLGQAKRLLGKTPGGPAKVAILSSGLMGSLSGSAVANTATTGTFTIPLMRSGGFRATTAAGIEAAASSGGALVPPVMGAGAYMMLEIVSPPVEYLTIVRAALLPAILYYLALFWIADLRSRRLDTLAAKGPEDGLGHMSGTGSEPVSGDGSARTFDESSDGPGTEPSDGSGHMSGTRPASEPAPPAWVAGATFAVGLSSLLVFLFAGFTVFRSASLALVALLAVAALHPASRPTPRRVLGAFTQSARASIPLVAAAACVGIVLGVVTLTGVGSKLPSTLLPLAENNLFLALLLLMVSSIVLGMGLPSAVCYLLLATLVGPALGDLGVVPLAAHLFIFYFGLLSMVTPPVALAAYTAASIARSPILPTAFAAFRFATIGFVLPYLFVYRPELLMLAPAGGDAAPSAIAVAFGLAALGTLPLAAALAGHLRRPLGGGWRAGLFAVALLLLWPARTMDPLPLGWPNLLGLALLIAAWVGLGRRSR